MKWTPYGPHAWLLQFADCVGDEAFARGRAIAVELERHPPAGLAEFVPSFTTVLLEFQSSGVAIEREDLRLMAARLEKALHARLPQRPVQEIPIIYDGADLDRVARTHDLTTSEVCAGHCAPVYQVYLLGFSPGFPYLGDLDPRLHTPRLPAPRPRVPAGSVAIGGEHTGIYTVDSPGGWNLLGCTPLKIFDPTRGGAAGDDKAMFLLKHGDRVKFIPIQTS